MSRFDRFMVHVDVGTDEKLAQLTDVERLCHIAGVLAVAAKSPVRGRLLVGDREATPREIAKRSDVSVRVARSTMDKLIDVGVLTRDDDLDCWRVHNWERFNPDPKQDRTNAERQARYRAKRVTLRNAPSNAPHNGQSNGAVTPPEVEVEVEHPPKPPQGGEVVTFERRPVTPDRLALARRLLDEFNGAASTDYGAFTAQGKPSESLKRIIGALTRSADLTFEDGAAAIRWRLANPFWEGKAHPGVVFGPGVFDQAQQSAAATVSADETRRRKLVGQ